MITKIICLCISAITFIYTVCVSKTFPREEAIDITVYHYKVPCVGDDVQLCYRIKVNNGEPQFLYDSIEGFNYEWGYNYVIRAEKVFTNNHVPDASSFRFKLKTIIKKEKVADTETFELPLDLEDRNLIKNKNGVCSYFGEVNIETGRYSCEDLAKATSAVFSHNSSKPGLVLVKLK